MVVVVPCYWDPSTRRGDRAMLLALGGIRLIFQGWQQVKAWSSFDETWHG
ncbi:MAG: hypothetical protein HC925_03660 [Coleofasciculaceae cyanobacterium SM2_3_26]|nr:hypothetical protein [Coleofasciculaceae cyanobacterium SM2_3_26]